MLKISEQLCIGCGACRDECPNHVIKLENGKAKANPNIFCMACGHCIAVCPRGATMLEGLDMSDVQLGGLRESALDSTALLRAIKGRRSIRRFCPDAVQPEQLELMFEAARFTPTGGNRQTLSFAAVQQDMKTFKELTFDGLRDLGNRDLARSEATPLEKRYAKRFLEIHQQYHESNGKIDRLFFNAPVVVAIMGDSPIDAGLAAESMELMAFAQGLGLVFLGFLVRSAAFSSPVREYLQVPEGSKVLAGMALGYPAVDFLRSVPRNKAKVLYR